MHNAKEYLFKLKRNNICLKFKRPIKRRLDCFQNCLAVM